MARKLPPQRFKSHTSGLSRQAPSGERNATGRRRKADESNCNVLQWSASEPTSGCRASFDPAEADAARHTVAAFVFDPLRGATCAAIRFDLSAGSSVLRPTRRRCKKQRPLADAGDACKLLDAASALLGGSFMSFNRDGAPRGRHDEARHTAYLIDPAGAYSLGGASAPTADPAPAYGDKQATAPTLAAAGAYIPDPGTTSSAAEIVDPPGAYRVAGASAPTTDPAGSYSGPGAGASTLAIAGTYVPVAGWKSAAAKVVDSAGAHSGAGASSAAIVPAGANDAAGTDTLAPTGASLAGATTDPARAHRGAAPALSPWRACLFPRAGRSRLRRRWSTPPERLAPRARARPQPTSRAPLTISLPARMR